MGEGKSTGDPFMLAGSWLSPFFHFEEVFIADIVLFVKIRVCCVGCLNYSIPESSCCTILI